jgi:hypothetical protein
VTLAGTEGNGQPCVLISLEDTGVALVIIGVSTQSKASTHQVDDATKQALRCFNSATVTQASELSMTRMQP